jgi:ribosomal protein L37AE/L43A
MTLDTLRPGPALPAAPEAATDPAPSLACPTCHTPMSMFTGEALKTGGDWKCDRCGQKWTASRLATVAEYGEWDRAREAKAAAAKAALVG